MRLKQAMKKIGFYLILILVIDVSLLIAGTVRVLPEWWQQLGIITNCAAVGGIGGSIYCLRGIYLNACVRKSWDDDWKPWYYIRPLVSHACGAVSYLFLKAGLLVLEAGRESDASNLGILALAFIAGLNVDKFLTKIEDIAQSTWGIEKSRTSKKDNK